MMDRTYDLTGKRVAILATDGFEESELKQPLHALQESGAETTIVSIPETSERIRAWADGDWGDTLDVDRTVDQVKAEDFHALVLPGGVINPDKLRMNEKAVAFVREFFDEGKPVAAICHGPWLIAEADVARGRAMTSWASIRADLENAGANWRDEEVVVDQGLVTSRSPDDLDAFVDKMLEEITEGVHAGQHA